MPVALVAFLGVLGVAVLCIILPAVLEAVVLYRKRAAFECPDTGSKAEVQVDVALAALTSVVGPALLGVRACSLWPGRRTCSQGCVDRAREFPGGAVPRRIPASPLNPTEISRPGTAAARSVTIRMAPRPVSRAPHSAGA